MSCPAHERLEHQVKMLEAQMNEVKKTIQHLADNQRDPRVWVAVFSFFGTCMATVGSFAGYITVAYLKTKGWL